MKNIIAIEGIDGCGKTTQVEKLVDYYTKQELRVKTISFPTQSDIGVITRKMLKTKLNRNKRLAVQYLMEADRLLVVEELEQYSEEYDLVICDRHYVSNIAYGVAEGIDMRFVMCLQQYKKPTVIYIDVPPAVAVERLKGEEESVYDVDIEFLKKVREVYTSIIPISNRIQGTDDIETVTKSLVTWIDVNILKK